MGFEDGVDDFDGGEGQSDAEAKEQPVTPAEEQPVTPAEELPVTPAEALPVTPAEELPVTPAEELPVTPAEALPVTPAEEHHAIATDYTKYPDGIETPMSPEVQQSLEMVKETSRNFEIAKVNAGLAIVSGAANASELSIQANEAQVIAMNAEDKLAADYRSQIEKQRTDIGDKLANLDRAQNPILGSNTAGEYYEKMNKQLDDLENQISEIKDTYEGSQTDELQNEMVQKIAPLQAEANQVKLEVLRSELQIAKYQTINAPVHLPEDITYGGGYPNVDFTAESNRLKAEIEMLRKNDNDEIATSVAQLSEESLIEGKKEAFSELNKILPAHQNNEYLTQAEVGWDIVANAYSNPEHAAAWFGKLNNGESLVNPEVPKQLEENVFRVEATGNGSTISYGSASFAKVIRDGEEKLVMVTCGHMLDNTGSGGVLANADGSSREFDGTDIGLKLVNQKGETLNVPIEGKSVIWDGAITDDGKYQTRDSDGNGRDTIQIEIDSETLKKIAPNLDPSKVPFFASGAPEPGEKVYQMGYSSWANTTKSGNIEANHLVGVVGRVTEAEPGMHYSIQNDLTKDNPPLNPGHSGGPIYVIRDGVTQLIGVNSFKNGLNAADHIVMKAPPLLRDDSSNLGFIPGGTTNKKTDG